MNNPIFHFIEEGMRTDAILESMGFEMEVAHLSIDDDEDDPIVQSYLAGRQEWIELWNPPASDGYSLAWKADTEDGPVIVWVKPKTEFAKVLLAFGESEVARQAAEADSVERDRLFKIKMNAIAGRPMYNECLCFHNDPRPSPHHADCCPLRDDSMGAETAVAEETQP